MSKVPESRWCDSHYVKVDYDFVTCSCFGRPDGMNGGCHNCKEMTLYQWHMCQDLSWAKSLMDRFENEDEIINFITERKQRIHPYPYTNFTEGTF